MNARLSCKFTDRWPQPHHTLSSFTASNDKFRLFRSVLLRWMAQIALLTLRSADRWKSIGKWPWATNLGKCWSGALRSGLKKSWQTAQAKWYTCNLSVRPVVRHIKNLVYGPDNPKLFSFAQIRFHSFRYTKFANYDPNNQSLQDVFNCLFTIVFIYIFHLYFIDFFIVLV